MYCAKCNTIGGTFTNKCIASRDSGNCGTIGGIWDDSENVKKCFAITTSDSTFTSTDGTFVDSKCTITLTEKKCKLVNREGVL